MKAVCVDAGETIAVKKYGASPAPLIEGRVYTVLAVSACPGCQTAELDVGLPRNGKPMRCVCGILYNTDTWWALASRFRPLLGDEQEALDRIEEEVKETELIPEPV